MGRTILLDPDGLPEAQAPAIPDRGCALWARCTSCPFRRCIEELPSPQQVRFKAAWREVLQNVALPDPADLIAAGRSS